MSPQVIVAGGGPVGLVAALVLAQAGVRVTVVEKRDALSVASRASTFHPPTLAILDHLGVLAPVVDQGVVVDRIQYRSAEEGVFAEFSLDTLRGETRFPFRLHLEQARVTPVLLQRLREHPHAQVLFGAELEGVLQDGERIAARVARAGSIDTLAADYIVGADGNRSAVRAALGIAFDAKVYPDKILRVMTDDPLEVMLPRLAPVTYLFNGARSVSFLRMADCWRIILRVPGEVEDASALDPGWILEQLRNVIPQCRRLPRVLMKDIYGVSRCVADRYRSGRAYLAGDSAHITNTRGGMNMNCGIHDAFAIGCAMAAAIAQDQPAHVAAAADERQRIARDMLIPRTDRNVAGGPAWLDEVKRMAADAGEARAYLRSTAMLDMTAAPPADARH